MVVHLVHMVVLMKLVEVTVEHPIGVVAVNLVVLGKV